MGSLSVWHWLIFLVVALLLFGGSGKISSIMGDVAKGIKSFKKGMTEEDTATAQPATPAQDPFRREEPRALDSAARPATPAAAPVQNAPSPQPNKAS
jgi:sec-independent protein translocase protein TatA